MTTPAATVELAIGAGRLVVRHIQSPGDVLLSDHARPNQRLIMLAPDKEPCDERIYSSFEHALGSRGILTCAPFDNLPSFVNSLAMPAVAAALWLNDDGVENVEVTVASVGPYTALVAATMLVACGWSPPKAIAVVEQVLPDSFDLDLEVGVSVARDRVAEYRALLTEEAFKSSASNTTCRASSRP